MWTKRFWKRTAERAIKTSAQVLSVQVTAAGVTNIQGQAVVSAWLLDWSNLAGVGLGAALASVLTSVASVEFGSDPENPSMVE